MLASTLRALKEDRDLSLRCPACGSGWTSIVLSSVTATGPLFACSECATRFFEKDCNQPEEVVPTAAKSEDSVFWEAQVEWLTGLMDYTPQRVLDIGCAEGHFLDEWPLTVRKFGIDSDETKSSVASAKGIRILQGTDECSFDVVTCYDVLSRSAFSNKVFGLFPHLVAPGGLLAIQIPTFESHAAYMAEKKGRAWTIYNAGERTTYYSRMFLQVRFSYHNHSFEFKMEGDRPGLDAFYDGADPRLHAQLDLYWVYRGGQDPAAYIRKFKDRVVSVHLKDGTGTESPHVPPGQGVLDWDGILAACKEANVEVGAIEYHECVGSPFDAVEASLKSFRDKGYSE